MNQKQSTSESINLLVRTMVIKIAPQDSTVFTRRGLRNAERASADTFRFEVHA